MGRWNPSSPCDLALHGEEHEGHDYVHADQVFYCDGEAIEHTPVEGNAYHMMWVDEMERFEATGHLDPLPTYFDQPKRPLRHLIGMHKKCPAIWCERAMTPEMHLSDKIVDWVYYAPAAAFYSAMAVAGAFGMFLMAITYLLYRRF